MQIVEGQWIDVYLEASPVGSGRRVFNVTKVGRKWAMLFYPPTCTTFEVQLADLERNRSAIPHKPSRAMRRRIKANLAQRRRLGLHLRNVEIEAAKKILDNSGGSA